MILYFIYHAEHGNAGHTISTVRCPVTCLAHTHEFGPITSFTQPLHEEGPSSVARPTRAPALPLPVRGAGLVYGIMGIYYIYI
jgi:hypothetical protein